MKSNIGKYYVYKIDNCVYKILAVRDSKDDYLVLYKIRNVKTGEIIPNAPADWENEHLEWLDQDVAKVLYDKE